MARTEDAESELRVGEAVVELAGSDVRDEVIEDAVLVRAWVVHQLVQSASTVSNVFE